SPSAPRENPLTQVLAKVTALCVQARRGPGQPSHLRTVIGPWNRQLLKSLLKVKLELWYNQRPLFVSNAGRPLLVHI
ncbi:hypothetical protein FRC08_001626, partial [Ceratobasidium sp. 394]